MRLLLQIMGELLFSSSSLLFLSPTLLSPQGVGFSAIAEALAMAAVKAVVASAAIIAGGRLVSALVFCCRCC